MIRTLAITDVETTGLERDKHECIEVAVALFDCTLGIVTESFASLIHCERNEAEDTNHISVASLRQAPPAGEVWLRVSDVIARAEDKGPALYVAHRAEFDRGYYPDALASRLPWVCSKTQIEFPRAKLGDHLVSLALAHDVPIWKNHRSLTDVMLLAHVFAAVYETGAKELQAMLAAAMGPKVILTPVAVNFDEKRNEELKRHGFFWNPTERLWVRPTAPRYAGAIVDALRKKNIEVRDGSP